MPDPLPVATPYARTSHPEQRKGGGLIRQTSGETRTALAEFCALYGFQPSKRVLVDDGVSAFEGLNATPNHELGKFLAEANRGLVPRGSCLVLENYDRLSRQNPWAAIGLVNDLRQLGIHVGRLDRMKLLRYDSTDAGDFFEAAVEFMRGNSESAAKSDRNGKAWRRKRDAARESKELLTAQIPAWVRLRDEDGGTELIPERAEAVRRIFALAAAGHGYGSIVGRLKGTPPFTAREEYIDDRGKRRFRAPRGAVYGAGRWTIPYVSRILNDRRALGECQPRGKGRKADGPPVPDYFPAAVTQAEWDAARPKRLPGEEKAPRKATRVGKHVNLWAGLVFNARNHEPYYAATKGVRYLISRDALETISDPDLIKLDNFEDAVLECLREIDPHEILNGASGPDEATELGKQFAGVEAELAEANAFMDAHGFSESIGRRVVALEDRKRDLAARLALARQKAAHPLSETWGEAQTLAATLKTAPDPIDARTRLRAALRRIVSEIWLLVIRLPGKPRSRSKKPPAEVGRDRVCVVQMHFRDRPAVRRFCWIYRAAGRGRPAKEPKPATFADDDIGDSLDLRNPAHVATLEARLLAVDLPKPPPPAAPKVA